MTLDAELVRAALPAYDLGGELGRGGWGIVLEARHKRLGREVAIKQLPRAFGADPAVRGRFATEARLLAALDHPHIVRVYDYVEDNGLCLLIMEKLTGGTVRDRFLAGGVTMEDACGIAVATCAGLHAAHERGILHRDIKAENLMFTGSGVLKVTDFGIAKVIGGSATMFTRTGEVLGTPSHMAPESVSGQPLTIAADVYATGVVLYELLAGQLPHSEDGDALTVVRRHAYEPPTELRSVAPTVPAGVADVVMRALATAPEDRYSSAEALGVALAGAAGAAWGPTPAAEGGRVSAAGHTEILTVPEGPTGQTSRSRLRGVAVAVAAVLTGLVVVAVLAAVRADDPGGTGRTDVAPDRPVARVIFEDDFSNPGSGWTQADFEAGSIRYVDGTYAVRVNRPATRITSDTVLEGAAGRAELTTLGDIAVQAKATRAAPVGTDFGLLCRASGETFYWGAIDSGGHARIDRSASDGSRTLATSPLPAASSTDPQQLRFECTGGNGTPAMIRLFVDGRLVVAASDAAALPPGAAGVAVGSREVAGAEVRFDDFVVTAAA
ncbi:MAG: serine/threonine-protein kinase [Acidimicrobiales bacterium]